MLFYDGIFLVFLVGLLLLSALLGIGERSVRARGLLLLSASYLFYAAWDVRFLALIAGSTIVDYALAARMPGAAPGRRRALLIASLCVNLGSLALFKYLDMGIETLNAIAGTALEPLALTLPVGISFFTFQSMSYTIDVYRGQLEPEPDFGRFALFVSFFPQLVAGPIIRAADFLPQVSRALARPVHAASAAVPLFVFGLFKKVVVADQLGGIADPIFADPTAFAVGDRALAALAFTGQIYCDFSGYTDMALALCALFGFDFPLNFRSPYLARGPQDFWRRWHISLSTWLRDYLYISLGGSRLGVGRTYVALSLTMLLGGLWHGASWTFVLWGAFHGGLLVTGRLIGGPALDHPLLSPLRWAFFLLLTILGWVIFRVDSMAQLGAMLDGLGSPAMPAHEFAWVVYIGLFYVALEQLAAEYLRQRRGPWWITLRYALAGVLLPLCFLLRPDRTPDFIYFQF